MQHAVTIEKKTETAKGRNHLFTQQKKPIKTQNLVQKSRTFLAVSRMRPQSKSTGLAPPGALGSKTNRTLPACGSA